MQDRALELGNYGEADRARMKLFLNMARRDVEARGFRFDWLEAAANVATVAGTQTANVPANFKTHGRLRPVTTTITEPRFVEWHEMDSALYTHQAAGTTSSGIPAYYSIYAGQYVFYPIPNAVYTYSAQYWRTWPDLSGDNDTYAMPTEHQDTLLYGALMNYAARDKDFNAVQFWQTMYEGKLRELKAHSALTQMETQSKVPMPDHYRGVYR